MTNDRQGEIDYAKDQLEVAKHFMRLAEDRHRNAIRVYQMRLGEWLKLVTGPRTERKQIGACNAAL